MYRTNITYLENSLGTSWNSEMAVYSILIIGSFTTLYGLIILSCVVNLILSCASSTYFCNFSYERSIAK